MVQGFYTCKQQIDYSTFTPIWFSMIDTAVPQTVHRELLRRYNINKVSAVDYRGLSSSRIFKCFGPDGSAFCLKYWPDEGQAQRLEAIHLGMKQLTVGGVGFTPVVMSTESHSSVVRYQGCWELISWLPGEANYLRSPNRKKLLSAVLAVAKMHDVWSEQQAVALSPTIAQRLQRLEQAEAICNRNHSRTAQATDHLAKRTEHHIKQISGVLRPKLMQLVRAETVVHFCIRDLRAEHLLFTGEDVTGVVDFGAAKVDDPMTDLVRLLSTLEPDDESARLHALADYADARGIAPLDYDKFRVMDLAATLLSAFQWYEWLHLEQRNFSMAREELVQRWREFLDRLDAMA